MADIMEFGVVGLGKIGEGLSLHALEKHVRVFGGLEAVPPYIEDTGEVDWLVHDALHLEVAVPVIAQAVTQLYASRDDKQYWARAITMMRHGFGGHPYGPDEAIARKGRGGPFPAKEPDRSGDAESKSGGSAAASPG